jgi:transcription elongation GreA/GreB family factor
VSVAFRRESDEEHQEPKFELPLPPGRNLVTARGFEMIQAKVVEFDAALAAAQDDETRAVIRRDLRYWTTRSRTAEIPPPPPADEAAFGSRVRYRHNGKEAEVDLVGSDEADPEARRITFTAPLAQALMGSGTGDLVDFNGKEGAIEVLAVGPIPD